MELDLFTSGVSKDLKEKKNESIGNNYQRYMINNNQIGNNIELELEICQQDSHFQGDSFNISLTCMKATFSPSTQRFRFLKGD